MSCPLKITEEPDYLHAVVTGKSASENVPGYLRDALRECEARQCFNVLLEENLTGRRLETWDVYQIASETSANNRGLPMTVFNTAAEAEQRLAGRPG